MNSTLYFPRGHLKALSLSHSLSVIAHLRSIHTEQKQRHFQWVPKNSNLLFTSSSDKDHRKFSLSRSVSVNELLVGVHIFFVAVFEASIRKLLI